MHILSGLYKGVISCWADKDAGQHPSCKTQPEKFSFPPRNRQTPQSNCDSFFWHTLLCQLSKMEFVAIASTPIAGKKEINLCVETWCWPETQLWLLFLELTYFFQAWGLAFSAVSLAFDGLTWLCKGLSELTASSLKPEWNRTQIREMANSMPQVPGQGRMLMLHPPSASWGYLLIPWWGAAPRTQWEPKNQGFIPIWMSLVLFQTSAWRLWFHGTIS